MRAGKNKKTEVKMEPRKNKLDKFFLLDLKKTIALLVFWFVIVILHNFIFTFFGIEEKIFFTLAIIVLPFYFIICFLYSIFERR